jgi:photosystem II stability/assembly factor-like uncharacterized protein
LMRPRFTILAHPGTVALTACLVIFFLTKLLTEQVYEVPGSLPFKKPPKEQRIQGMAELEFEQTKDLRLNEVPRERLLDALQYKMQLESERHLKNGSGLPNFNWIERGPNNVSGRTRAILVDANDPSGNTIWTGGVAGGIWRTRNMLANQPEWENIGDFFENISVGFITQDPQTPDYIYVGTGEGWFNGDALRGLGIWRTADGGETWEHLTSTRNSSFHYVNKLLVDPSGVVFASTNTGLFRSEDKGETWNNVLTGRNVAIIQSSTGVYYTAVSGFGILSSQSGVSGSWTALRNGLPTSGFGRIEIAAAPSDPNIVYAVFAANDGTAEGIYRSVDAGENWVSVNNPEAFGMSSFTRNQAWFDLTIAVDPNNPQRVFIGGIDILVSNNGGASWQQITQWFGGGGFQYTHADQHLVYFHPGSSDTIYFTNDGGVYRTVNGSNSVPAIRFVSNGYNVTQFYACDLHPGFNTDWFLAGAQDNGTQLFRQTGINNTVSVSGGDGAFVHIDKINPEIQISSYIYNNYYITNNAWSSGSVSNISIGESTGYFINPTGYDSRSKTLYCSYNAGAYARIEEVGLSNRVSMVEVPNFFNGRISAVTVAPLTEERVYFGLNNGGVIRVDNALSDTPEALVIRAGNGWVSSIAVDDLDENRMVVTYSNYGGQKVFETFNGGQSWMDITGNLPDIPVRFAIFNPNDNRQVVLGTELGVWATSGVDGIATRWEPANDGLANTRVSMLRMRPSDNLMIAATHGRGLFSSYVFAEPQAIIRTEQSIGYVGSQLAFSDNSIGEFTNRLWSFGDGNQSTELNPVHVYQDTGLYTVTLLLDNDVETSTTIRILPDKATPFEPGTSFYSGDFERDRNDFAAVSVAGSVFEAGRSEIPAKSGTKSGSYAWVLGKNEEFYQPRTTALLYTPKFDMGEEGIYRLSFYAKHDINQFDGLQVEYSQDNGQTWSLLGTPQTGWYNFSSSAPGAIFPQGQGYLSGRSPSFRKYETDISTLAGLGGVAFRFVFRSQGTGLFPGMVIDDFEIRKLGGDDLRTEIISFTGDFNNEGRISLNWSTRPEFNCQGFGVEVSINGRDWENVAYIQGGGFSIDANQYTYTTPNTRPRNLYFYRLEVINENQQTGYSFRYHTPSITIRKNLRGLNVFSIYPTLASDHVNILFTDQVNEEVTLQLFSMEGKHINSQKIIPGGPFLRMELGTLPSGVYLLHVDLAGDPLDRVFKIIVQ